MTCRSISSGSHSSPGPARAVTVERLRERLTDGRVRVLRATDAVTGLPTLAPVARGAS